eukprot:3259556-Prymnesium_polylepis.1
MDLPRRHPWLGRAPDGAGRKLPQVSQFCGNPRPPAYWRASQRRSGRHGTATSRRQHLQVGREVRPEEVRCVCPPPAVHYVAAPIWGLAFLRARPGMT